MQIAHPAVAYLLGGCATISVVLMKQQLLASGSLLSSGLLAGTFLYASSNVLPTFDDVAPNVHLTFRTALMRHNSVLMPLLMVLSIVLPASYALAVRTQRRHSAVAALAASGFALIALITTMFGNVPINGMIRMWAETGPPQNWEIILRRWDTFHAIRATAGIASFICVIVGANTRTADGSSRHPIAAVTEH